MMKKNIIAWDLGATKCAAGLVEYDFHRQSLICQKQASIFLQETKSLTDLIEQVEAGLLCKMSEVDAVCIGAAGQYDGCELRLEGVYPYLMNFAEIAAARNWPVFDVIHDYAPVVCATFTDYMHNEANIKRLNVCPMQQFGRRVAIGVGTGLGMKDGVLFDSGDFWLGKNEIGHIGVSTPPFAEQSYLDRHQALINFLQAPGDQVITFEKILSGQGLVRLHQFFYGSDSGMTPEEVSQRMKEGQAEALLSTFAWYFGLLIGTVQLAFMPEGGIWITGGVALKNTEVFDHPEFYAGIYVSPAYRAQREVYPLGVLCNQEHALVGSGYYALRKLLPVTEFELVGRGVLKEEVMGV